MNKILGLLFIYEFFYACNVTTLESLITLIVLAVNKSIWLIRSLFILIFTVKTFRKLLKIILKD